jgi:hypothetical protein
VSSSDIRLQTQRHTLHFLHQKRHMTSLPRPCRSAPS